MKHRFVHLSFNSTLQLINGISGNLKTLLRYFNGTALVVFLKFLLGPETVFSINLDLKIQSIITNNIVIEI